MPAIDEARWRRISPLLDELLDADPAARAARLAVLRSQDVALADDVAALLAQQAAVETADFLGKAAVAPAGAGLAGRVVGSWTLERPLGQGGMGSVWLGCRSDGRFEGRAAVKFLNLALLGRGGAERFAREGTALARLAHPNIAHLIDAGVDAGGQPYLVLEYIDGEPIDAYCDQRALPVRARLRLMLDVLAAVSHAHTRLVLHRDLKPSNVLVDAAGRVKLLDFGVAKLLADQGAAEATALTLDAGRAFTPDYAAPEQVTGGEVSTATDVYALGLLLYRLLSGRPALAADGVAVDRLRAVLEVEPAPPSDAAARAGTESAALRASTPQWLARELRGDLDNIVARALKKAPAERYPTVDALADDLQRYLDDRPVAARADSFGYRARKFLRRHRAAVAAASAGALLLAAGVAAVAWQAAVASHERDRALAVSARDEAMVEFVEVMLTEAARGDRPLKVSELLARSRELIGRRSSGSADSDAAVLTMMGRFFVTLGEPVTAEENLRLAAERAAGSTDRVLRGLIECHLAFAQSLQGRRDEARARFAAAMPLAADDPATEADCHQAQAYVAQNHNDAAGALWHAQRALDLRRASGRARPLREASLLGSVAYGHYLTGNALQADHYYAQAVAQFRAAGADNTALMVTILNNWGIASFAAGDVRRALACYDEALEIAGRLASGADAPPYLFANRGIARMTLARHNDALADFARARATGAATGNLVFVASALAGSALTLREKGDRAAAAALLAEARAMIGTALPPDSVPGITVRMSAARIALLDGRLEEARSLYDEVLDFFDRRGMRVGPVVTALRGRADVRLAQGRADEGAAADLERALSLARRLQGEMPQSVHTGLVLAARARLRAMQGRESEARADAQQALAQLLPMLGQDHPETQRVKSLLAPT